MFTFTEGEQEFYRDKGLNAPKRCKQCRAAKKARGGFVPRSKSEQRRVNIQNGDDMNAGFNGDQL